MTQTVKGEIRDCKSKCWRVILLKGISTTRLTVWSWSRSPSGERKPRARRLSPGYRVPADNPWQNKAATMCSKSSRVRLWVLDMLRWSDHWEARYTASMALSLSSSKVVNKQTMENERFIKSNRQCFVTRQLTEVFKYIFNAFMQMILIKSLYLIIQRPFQTSRSRR